MQHYQKNIKVGNTDFFSSYESAICGMYFNENYDN